MMPQVIALAIRCFIDFAFENLANWFIRLVLEEFALINNAAEEAMGDQLLVRARLSHERPRRMVEQTIPADDCLLIDSCGL
jgi:hypothetical protein